MLSLARSIWGRVCRRLASRYYKIHEVMARTTRWNASTVLKTMPGQDPHSASTRCAVFVHYDRQGLIHDYVLSYLKGLNDVGCRIWFVSNAPRLEPQEIAKITPLVAKLIHRNNYGLDMGGYKDGILDVLKTESPKQLIVCNDSVYGPLQPLAPLLEKARPEDADVWGMTESYEFLYHLQSYFLVFNQRAIENPAFRKYWQSVPYVDARGWLIHHGEIAISQHMLRAGAKLRAIFSTDEIIVKLQHQLDTLMQADYGQEHVGHRIDRTLKFKQSLAGNVDIGTPLNPTHFFWDVLISEMRFPFLKRDLLQFNPARVPGLASWRRVIEGVSRYDVEEIRNHLLPRLKNRSI